jgi:hypothetical protein
MVSQLLAHAASRKVAMTITAMFLIVGLGALAAFVPALLPQLMTMVGGIVSCLALYCGANVADGKFQQPPRTEGSVARPLPKPPVKKAPAEDEEEGS